MREADRGRTSQAEGTGIADALRCSTLGTSDEQKKKKKAVMTRINEEKSRRGNQRHIIQGLPIVARILAVTE